ncbi:MAG TPA: DinB family protein, partial [Aggregatilineales bacterium]|nr:DinB family protein [Aggregatilineales bacterium]
MTISTTPTPKNCDKVLAQLAQNQTIITEKLAHVPESSVHIKPNDHDWSLIEVVSHLRSCADLAHFRIFAMLSVDTPHLPTIHPRMEWQKIVPYTHLPLQKSLMAYALQREEMLITLRGLDEGRWMRTGIWENRAYS